MVNRKLSILVICVLIAVGVIIHFTSTGRVGGPSDKAQVEALAEILVSAVMKGDELALQEILHEEFVFDAMDMLATRSQFIGDVVAGDLWAKLSDDRELEISGKSAFLTAPFEANVVLNGEFLQVSGTMTVDFIKSDKTWSVRTIRVMPVF